MSIEAIYRERNRLLHIATSARLPATRKLAREKALALSLELAQAFNRLPDNRPQWPPEICVGGVTMWLQYVKGDNAKYVLPVNYRPDQFVYRPSSRLDRLIQEQLTNFQVLEEIKDLESIGLSPIEGDESK